MEIPLIAINPNSIEFDDNNPRGETAEEIKSDLEFRKLKKSVGNYNILVPLIVRKNNSKTKPYKLVDGERRLRAALDEKKDLVPAHIIEGNEENAKILAYQIHMLRKQWTPQAEIKSIKDIVAGMRKECSDEVKLKKELKLKTGLSASRTNDILTILKYDDDTIVKIENGEMRRSYFIEIEKYFIPFLKEKLPSLYKKYSEDKLRKILAKKVEKAKFGDTRFIRDHLRLHFNDDENKLNRIIKEFLDKPSQNLIDSVKKLKRKSRTYYRKSTTKKSSSSAKPKKRTHVPDEINHKVKLCDIEQKIILDNIFDLIFNHLKESIIEFEKRTNYNVTNEKQLQDLIYSILRALFDSIEFEDPTEKMCGKSNRLDFVLKDHHIIIEVKYVRDKDHGKKISEELSVDYPRYANSPYGNKIINYIYDPDKNIDNHELFREQLKKLLPKANHYIQ